MKNSHFLSAHRRGRLAVLGSSLVILSGLTFSGCNRAKKEVPPPKPPEVSIALPTAEKVTDYEEFHGRSSAINAVVLRSRVSGYLDEVRFKDGAAVKKDEVLFKIDPRSYQAEQRRAAATVEQFQARLKRLDLQLERFKELVNRKAISQDEYEATLYDRNEAQASLAAAVASEEMAALNVKYTEVISPLDGQISRRMVDPGNLIKADDTALTTIISSGPIHVYFDVDERTVLRLRRLIQEGKIKQASDSGVVVEISLADEDEFSLTGVVNFVDNQVDEATGTLRFRAEIENSQQLLSPGLFMRVRFPVGEAYDALLVPEEALATDQGQRFIYVVDQEDNVSYRPVQAGMLHKGHRVIKDGLQATDRVVVTGLQRIKPGIKVTPLAPGTDQVVTAQPSAATTGQQVVEKQTPEKQAAQEVATEPAKIEQARATESRAPVAAGTTPPPPKT